MPPQPQQPRALSQETVASEFTSYYLQRATKEFAEDLDRVRAADDFKADALPMLVAALRQGTALFSADEQRRIVTAAAAAATDDATAATAAAAAAAAKTSGPERVRKGRRSSSSSGKEEGGVEEED